MIPDEEVVRLLLNRFITKNVDVGEKMTLDECLEFEEADKRFKQVSREIVRKIAQIRNKSLGPHRIWELNREINELTRERVHWEHRIIALRGDAFYARYRAKMTDSDSCSVVDVPNVGAAKKPPELRKRLTWTVLDLAILYLNKAEAWDKIGRAIQYGSMYMSNGEPGTAQNIDKSTRLARRVFRLFKFVNNLRFRGLVSPNAPGTSLPLILLEKSKNLLLLTFYFLDQFAWLGETGIYENKERLELVRRISLFCWLGSSACATLVKDEQYQSKHQNSDKRTLALVKAGMDMIIAVGLLQLAPKKITPRVTGAFGFMSSLISCYRLLPSPQKVKTT